nr:protein YegR [Escherichia coli]
MGEGEVKKIAAISLISIFIMSGCAVHNDETSIGKFGLAYKSNIQRKLDNQYYTEAEASLARGRISGAENIVKNDATHFCVTQGKKMQIVELKTEGVGLHGVARLTFKCGE